MPQPCRARTCSTRMATGSAGGQNDHSKMGSAMKIACLGWGSLIWDPRELPVQAWQTDGPLLPVEFSRVSEDGRVTLVIDQEGRTVPTLWAILPADNLEAGIAQLAVRENVKRLGAIGRWPSADNSSIHAIVAAWARRNHIDGVVWTALKPGLQKTRGVRPSLEDILGHIATLSGGARANAEEYVRRAPQQVATEWRDAIRRAFGPGQF